MPNDLKRIKLRSGDVADVRATTTKALALEGEIHWCPDGPRLFIYNKSGDLMLEIPITASESDTPWTGTFQDGSSQTVTVVNGIITDVS